MSDTFFWNVRGLNETLKHSPLASWINSRNLSFGALLETHVRESNKNRILSTLGPGWSVLSNYHHSELGKIWIIFKQPIMITQLFGDKQSITCEVTLEDGKSLFFSAIYASNDHEERKELWQSLRDTNVAFNLDSKPWMVCGDFNEILDPSETSNPSQIASTSAMRLFGRCLSDLGLFDLSYQGPKFTWSNHRPSDPVGKRLDRCLVNDKWHLSFPSSHCSFLPPEFSDHTPCHILLSSPPPSFGTRPFKFFNFLANHPSFLPSFSQAWVAAGDRALSLRDLCYKLKSLKRHLKSFSKESFSEIEKRVINANSLLKSLQVLSLEDPSPANVHNESVAHDQWALLRLAEESFFRQRSRIRWLAEGDFNTRFFHMIMRARNASNAIKYLLKSDGSRTSTLQEVHELVQVHFSEFLNKIRGDYCPFLHQFLDRLCTIHCFDFHQTMMTSTVGVDIVKEALFKLPLHKTPGPDGLTAEFFRVTWEVLGSEVVTAVQQFFSSSFLPKSLNATTLVLIAKRQGAEKIGDFRPISCCNTLYKIISRILSDRLKRMLPSVVVPNQTAFIKDRLLLENVLLASEVVQGYNRQHSTPRITLKVDISKAFDSIRWDFLLLALRIYHIPEVFISWIRACISTPTFSVSINGVSSGYFKSRSGLRQGDPLSPILFVLAMNVLSLMLNRAAVDGIFKYHPRCHESQLTHLSFADDLLIFLDGSEESLAGIFTVLSLFEKLSGLAVNISKTSLFCSGLDSSVLTKIRDKFCLKPDSLPVRYLGLPLCSRKLSVKDCDPLIAQIRRNVNSWMHKHLSLAGRLRLISTVISGIVGFWSAAFFLPKKVIKLINSLSSSFLWHGTLENSTSAKVAWNKLTLPKSEGGLGIRSLASWNNTCGLKLIWMLFFRGGSIWVAWMRHRYISNSSFWALNEENSTFSWTFHKLLKLRNQALSFFSVKIGNGEDSFFWWDPWTPFGPLIQFMGPTGPSSMGIPLSSLVCERLTIQGWDLPAARSDQQVTLHTFISSIQPSFECDKPCWTVGDKSATTFCSRSVWESIRTSQPPVTWAPLIWHKGLIPKHATNAWLFTLNRNPTADRLIHWGLDVEPLCFLCGTNEESRDHLFFECSYTQPIWLQLTRRLGLFNAPSSWQAVLLWLHDAAPQKATSIALLQSWQATIYEVWKERNRRFHDGVTSPFTTTLSKIRNLLKLKAFAMKNTGSKHGEALIVLFGN